MHLSGARRAQLRCAILERVDPLQISVEQSLNKSANGFVKPAWSADPTGLISKTRKRLVRRAAEGLRASKAGPMPRVAEQGLTKALSARTKPLVCANERLRALGQ